MRAMPENNGQKTERLEIRYVRLSDARRWNRNPKKHDIGALVQSIRQHGFKNPPKYEPTLNNGAGGLVIGNGRDEALEWMEKEDANNPPRGIAVDEDGRWTMPVIFGVDAASQAAAEAYGVDDNNLTMMGGDFSPYDIAKMWDVNAYNELLQSLAKQGEFSVSMDKNDVDMFDAVLNGLMLNLPEVEHEGGEARRTKITLVLDLSETDRLEEIVEAVRKFLDDSGYRVGVDV